MVHAKKVRIIDGYEIKYHANGKTTWSKGKTVNGVPDGYWEWYRINVTLKRSGYFSNGKQTGRWVTYDNKGKTYKVTKL
jgi:antitoxin component YwqK of YwqJK toxin-antitoxin module